jgi:hypothetical protein
MAQVQADPTFEARHYQASMSMPHWHADMELEVQDLGDNGTWKLVPPCSGINLIDSK